MPSVAAHMRRKADPADHIPENFQQSIKWTKLWAQKAGPCNKNPEKHTILCMLMHANLQKKSNPETQWPRPMARMWIQNSQFPKCSCTLSWLLRSWVSICRSSRVSWRWACGNQAEEAVINPTLKLHVLAWPTFHVQFPESTTHLNLLLCACYCCCCFTTFHLSHCQFLIYKKARITLHSQKSGK